MCGRLVSVCSDLQLSGRDFGLFHIVTNLFAFLYLIFGSQLALFVGFPHQLLQLFPH